MVAGTWRWGRRGLLILALVLGVLGVALATGLPLGSPEAQVLRLVAGVALALSGLVLVLVAALLGAMRELERTSHDWTVRSMDRVASEARLQALQARAEVLDATTRLLEVGVLFLDEQGHPQGEGSHVGELAAAWPTLEAFWHDLRAALGTLPESTCDTCGRPEHRVSRTVELVDPAGNGRWFRVLLAGHGHTFGRHDASLAVLVREVTGAALAREQLSRKESDFLEVISGAPDGIVIHVDGIIRYVNREMLRILGLEDADGIVGSPLARILDADPDDSLTGLHTVLSGDGRLVSLRVHRSQEVAFEGEKAFLVVVRDVTERVQMEQRLRLADRLALVGTLAAGVAHEVNNPLSWVLGRLDLLRGKLLEEGRQDLLAEVDAALDGATRVRQIVRDLKVFGGHEGEQPEPVDLNAVIESAINLASALIAERAEVVREYAAEPVLVSGHDARLGQVALNLLVNAAQAFPTEGCREGHRIVVQTFRLPEDRVGFAVVDNGRGMSPRELERAFDPFFTTKEPGEGTGLGLHICREIVERHGGSLGLSSCLGQGTRAEVVLPALKQESGLDGTGSESRTFAGDQARVLVVDDEVSVGEVVEAALSDHLVVVVQNIDEALRWCRRADFDVILCDLMMPGGTGTDLYRRLKEEMPGYERRMVLMSGAALGTTMQRFLEEQGVRFIEKPFSIDQVRRLVARRARMRRELSAE